MFQRQGAAKRFVVQLVAGLGHRHIDRDDAEVLGSIEGGLATVEDPFRVGIYDVEVDPGALRRQERERRCDGQVLVKNLCAERFSVFVGDIETVEDPLADRAGAVEREILVVAAAIAAVTTVTGAETRLGAAQWLLGHYVDYAARRGVAECGRSRAI